MKMNTLSLHVLENFIKKNQIATQNQAKEIRVSIKEMNEISVSLASVMTRLMALSEDNEQLIQQVQQLKLQLNVGDSRHLDGGGFKE